VADDDTAVVAFNTPQVTLNPPANDITYGGATLKVSSIDLDPSAAGQQTSRSVAGGTFVLQPDGTVVYTPAAGFDGKATITYTIRDSSARLSNEAKISVTVNPDPNAALRLFSFEEDTEGWAADIGSPNAGTLTQSSAFHTHGSFSLRIDTTASGGWFGRDLASALDLSAKPHLKFDLQTGPTFAQFNGTSIAVVVKTVNWNWCQKLDWGFINANTTTTVDVDLTQPGCVGNPAGPYDVHDIRAIFVYLNNGGTIYIDNVRAE
jgi:mannan endo-1,4-beta-mannosidase